MIHYDLVCAGSHEFDGWFRDSAAFDEQAADGLVLCPECGDTAVTRALMAPSLRRKGNARARGKATEPASVEVGGETEAPVAAQALAPKPEAPEAASAPVTLPKALPDQVRAMLQRLRAEVETRCDYVGNGFADEARRIKSGESARRGIYGETTPEQAEALADEGIEVARIPWVPRADG